MTKSLMAEILENPAAYASGNPFDMDHPLYLHHFNCRQAAQAAAEVDYKNWETAYNEAYWEEHKK